jgi:hypothetical protein
MACISTYHTTPLTEGGPKGYWPCARVGGLPPVCTHQKIYEAIWNVEGVVGIHCLHVWALTSGKNLATLHVQVRHKK